MQEVAASHACHGGRGCSHEREPSASANDSFSHTPRHKVQLARPRDDIKSAAAHTTPEQSSDTSFVALTLPTRLNRSHFRRTRSPKARFRLPESPADTDGTFTTRGAHWNLYFCSKHTILSLSCLRQSFSKQRKTQNSLKSQPPYPSVIVNGPRFDSYLKGKEIPHLSRPPTEVTYPHHGGNPPSRSRRNFCRHRSDGLHPQLNEQRQWRTLLFRSRRHESHSAVHLQRQTVDILAERSVCDVG